MVSQSPWSIKGIDPEAREAAKMAARKAGMTLGGWLTRTILAVASHELKRGGQQADADLMASGGPDLSAPRPPALTEEAILKSIQQLIQRVEHIEHITQESLAPVVEKVDTLAERVEEVSSKTGIVGGPMERAMQRLAERVDQIETEEASQPQERHRPRRSRLARMFNLP